MAELLLSGDGTIRAANRRALQLFGLERSEIEGTNLRRWVNTKGPGVDDLLERFSRSSCPIPGALDLSSRDRETISCRAEGARIAPASSEGASEPPLLLLRLNPKQSAGSRFSLLTQQVVDLRGEIARRRHAELLLQHQKGLLERIVGNHPLNDVLNSIATFVEQHTEEFLCSILLVSEDRKRLVFGAAPSLPGAYNEAVDGLKIGPMVGSCGTAAFTGETVMAEDIATDQRWADFKDLAAEHGLAACWSEPVKGPQGEVLATLAMYYRAPGRPRPDDLYLTSIGVDLTAIAILSEKSRSALKSRAAELAAADRRKDRFLAMLSHELRNPLAPIVNTLEVLSTKSNSTEVVEHVARLQRQTTHLSRLVDDLLDISRISHGAVELKIAPVDVRSCVEQAVDSVKDLISDRRQSLTLPEPGEPLIVDGDSDRLRQIFSNLLTNAAKYTPEEGAIEIALCRENNRVVASVRDNGEGFTPNLRKYLFEPFSQGGKSAIDSREGLGLGLTLVKQLVECHGGTVDGHSDGPKRGSVFTVRLPISVRAGHPRAHESVPPALEVLPLQVLLVEDNHDNAEALKILLELWGHTVRVSHDGNHAVDAALDLQPDVLLLDIDLPGRDGYGVLKVLRQRGFSTEQRLTIALTGFGRLQDMKRTEAAGFHHHMTKPADPAVLRKLLADFSTERRSRAG